MKKQNKITISIPGAQFSRLSRWAGRMNVSLVTRTALMAECDRLDAAEKRLRALGADPADVDMLTGRDERSGAPPMID